MAEPPRDPLAEHPLAEHPLAERSLATDPAHKKATAGTLDLFGDVGEKPNEKARAAVGSS